MGEKWLDGIVSCFEWEDGGGVEHGRDDKEASSLTLASIPNCRTPSSYLHPLCLARMNNGGRNGDDMLLWISVPTASW